MSPLDLSAPLALHIVGIGGAGMSAIAMVLASMGHKVSGSDLKDSPGLERLRVAGVEVHIGHQGAHVGPEVQAVTISTAIPPANPEVAEAHRRGIPVLRRAEALGAICATRRPIAVAGTHGKTTTSSMLALVLVEAGMRPSFIIGGELTGIGTGAVWSEGEWFVVEADESDGTFLELGAEVALVTSVEPDHLSYWGSWANLRDAFERFLHGAAGLKVVCADDPVAGELGRSAGAVSYGTSEGADYRMVDVAGGRTGIVFGVERGGRHLAEVRLPVPGLHNARNACATVATAVELGASVDSVTRGLARYAGVARRYQFRGERDGVTFVDDYAHLPGEVKEILAAATHGGWRRIVCVFQPHRYSRTEALWRDFAGAFDDADVVVLTEIYAQGETPRPGVTAKRVLEALLDARPGRTVYWFPGRADLARNVSRVLRPGDLCLTLGAGDVTLLASEIQQL